MSVKFKIEGQSRIFDFRKFNKHRQAAWKKAWEEAIGNFLTELLANVPTLHGGTKRAFENIASEYGATFDNTPNMTFVVWEKWADHFFKEYAQVTHIFEFEFKGELVIFEITDFPDTFQWNDYSGTAYRKFWLKGAPPWGGRNSNAPQGEPWNAVTEAGRRMKQFLLEKANEIIPISVRQAFKFKTRRDRPSPSSFGEGMEE